MQGGWGRHGVRVEEGCGLGVESGKKNGACHHFAINRMALVRKTVHVTILRK